MPTSAEAKNAQRAALITLIVTAGLTVYFGFLAYRQLDTNSIWATLNTLGMTLANLAGFWFSRRGRHVLGTWLVLGGLMVGVVTSPAIRAGLGLALFISAPLFVAVVAGQTLPPRQVPWAVGLGVGAGIIAGLGDYFWPWPRPLSPVYQTLPIIATGVVLILGWGIVRRFPHYSLRTKLLISSVTVVALTVGAQSIIFSQIATSEIRAQVGNSLVALAEDRATTIGSRIGLQADVLRALALNKFLQDGLEEASRTNTQSAEALRAADERWRRAVEAGRPDDPLILQVLNHPLAGELNELRERFSQSELFLTTDQHGATVASTQVVERYYHGDEAWWQTASSRGIFIGLIEQGFGGPRLGIAVAVPAHEREQIVGVALTLLHLDQFADDLASARRGKTGRTEIYFEGGGGLKLHEAADGSLKLELEREARLDLQRLIASSEPFLEIEHDGKVALSSSARVRSNLKADPIGDERGSITGLGWYVVVSQEKNEALEPVAVIMRANFLITVVALLIAGLAAVVVAQLLTRPLTRLTAVAARVSAGDLKVQAPVESGDEIGALATTFNVMTTQLRETLEGLEQRVADRTRALATSAEVSRRLSTLLDPTELVKQVVERVQRAFGYYHVHIYLFDESRENLVMRGGTGEAGALMLTRGHKLPRGKGLVGRAAETNQIVLVPETARDPGWLPNPLLPETKAEVAVPIAIGEEVLGVIDVQHNVVGGLTQDDADLLQAIANQMAIALQNARIYRQAQRRAEVEALVNSISQRLQSTTTVDEALQVTAREVGRALGGVRVQVRLAPTNGHTAPPTGVAESQN
ncbi:MAG: GAF domain-containing protein [Anaerolineales bacterium]|nr:GAF domain-containing protein [Anaerolineales bacterium]